MQLHPLLVPPIPETILAPNSAASWLANQLRNLGRFLPKQDITTEEHRALDKEYHLFARTFPLVGTWENAQRVAARFGVILIQSPVIFWKEKQDPTRADFEEALIDCCNRFYELSCTSRRELLREIDELQTDPGSIPEAKKQHPIVECLTWFDVVDDSKLQGYLKQFAIFVEKL